VTHRTTPTLCPTCGHKLDAATGLDHDHKPSPGDLSVCIQCGEILEFDEEIKLILISEGTIEKLDLETMEDLVRTRDAIKALRRTIN
jgi:hypothetical protein